MILALLGAIIPYAGFLIVRGGAKREADRRGAQIEKYLPYAALTPLQCLQQMQHLPRFSDH
ncbi:MAG: hypothetical protein CM15mP3_08550 [Candidatus Poseidoniales archaeon]|nr:MAG: hypothetical protein CM15mP3_08550 [Candidatus Poseidoniales archaeon]